ncbi:hypothetical protein AMK27_39915 [Streptomyces sp. CB02009]|uniref:hypothetical protein n=1 Tax=Streptomyces sp. CB02009 TaxID=1703938 RepID=UPI00093FBB99|nr:hypothetical protein [Streptomyces sp. CB02009]OKJ45960.1 hypothetical protein AMK27_39915 [Streptomyces sp. CB02009]
MFRLIRTRTRRQLLTHIQELHDRASSQQRRRQAAEHRIAEALKILEADDSELSTRLSSVLTAIAPAPDSGSQLLR